MTAVSPSPARSLTVDEETVSGQGVGAQPGDTVGQLAQLPVQPLSVRPMAHGVRPAGADGFHASGCTVLLRPGDRGMPGLLKRGPETSGCGAPEGGGAMGGQWGG